MSASTAPLTLSHLEALVYLLEDGANGQAVPPAQFIAAAEDKYERSESPGVLVECIVPPEKFPIEIRGTIVLGSAFHSPV